MDIKNFYRLVEKHRLNISNGISKYHKNTVAYGPFKGLKLVNDTSWSAADRGTMILGLYEQEILNTLISIKPHRKNFINIGAADGYYGIGVLVNQLFEKSYCFELSEKGRKIIKRNATLNNVIERIFIKGEAKNDFFKDIPNEDLNDSVLLVDIEGDEFELINRALFEFLHKTIILIEIHDWIKDSDQKINLLIKESQNTHKLKKITTSDRNLSVYRELKNMNDTDRWILCSEGRPRLMSWFRFDPIEK